MKKLLVIIPIFCILFTNTKVYSQGAQTKTILVDLEKYAFFYETEYGKHSVMKKTNEVILELNEGEKRGVFLKFFDFPEELDKDKVDSAKLKFFGNALNGDFSEFTKVNLSIIRSSYSWYAAGLSPKTEFYNQFYIKEKIGEKPNDWHEVDITTHIKSLEKGQKHYGFEISLEKERSWGHVEFENDGSKPFIEIKLKN